MALDNNYLDQLKIFSVAMKGYYKSLSENITSTTNTLPMFEDIVVDFDYSEILRHVITNQQASANFMTGAMVDTIHDIMAVEREFVMRRKDRASYFADSVPEFINDSNYYDSFYAVNHNLFKGTSPDQA